MKPLMRKASARWTGGAIDGNGEMNTESCVLKQSRFSTGNSKTKSQGTNPPELMAAAHAGSFSMALAHELETAGFVPNHITTDATMTLERMPTGWMITGIKLQVLAKVPKAAQSDFIDASLRAKTGCLISRLLRANISMHAKLENGELAVALPRPPARKRNPLARKRRLRSLKPE